MSIIEILDESRFNGVCSEIKMPNSVPKNESFRDCSRSEQGFRFAALFPNYQAMCACITVVKLPLKNISSQ